MSVKDYSIRHGVQYRVMESDHLKYVGRCKEFGNGCTWMIRVALRQRKRNWEVRRADAAVTIKVLQEATESTYRFKPSYRKVWKIKQKAVAQIYGDREESYVELPRWIFGMQATMDGTVALLKTSWVHVGGEVDESTEYFHRLFWTFPPCIEAFKHCKPLVSIDGMHLHGKYGGTLLLAITQDGNSNILPVAHNGIKAALEALDSGWKPPHAYCVYCIRHVAANFALNFKSQDARRMLVNAEYAKTEVAFD
ncbi:uncharacterized protein LOC130981038 [Arachis stenosperma]|uniref:uncharacterized protein LOC130981038 n=1 Tax=Arachis stenosperma TaxID=217475 RepID=UPI0025ABCDF8|nr:uncharacterized protein LOC130981038 [Arachis stenosperma]